MGRDLASAGTNPSHLAPIRPANEARQLPCGSGRTKGEGMPLHFTSQIKLDRALQVVVPRAWEREIHRSSPTYSFPALRSGSPPVIAHIWNLEGPKEASVSGMQRTELSLVYVRIGLRISRGRSLCGPRGNPLGKSFSQVERLCCQERAYQGGCWRVLKNP